MDSQCQLLSLVGSPGPGVPTSAAVRHGPWVCFSCRTAAAPRHTRHACLPRSADAHPGRPVPYALLRGAAAERRVMASGRFVVTGAAVAAIAVAALGLAGWPGARPSDAVQAADAVGSGYGPAAVLAGMSEAQRA